MEHFSSRAAWATSARNPCDLSRVLSLSPLGCPRFLCALNKAICSSLGKDRNRADWFGFCRSATWELGSSVVALGSAKLGLDLWRLSSLSPDVAGASEFSGSGCWLSEARELVMHGELALSVGCMWTGLSRANKVMLILVACEGLIRFRLASVSHCSHSSSARISPEPLSVNTHLLKGAIPFKI